MRTRREQGFSRETPSLMEEKAPCRQPRHDGVWCCTSSPDRAAVEGCRRRRPVVPQTDDPVADLALLGLAYYENAVTNADLYRVMFMERPHDADDAQIGWDTFEALIAGVQRCITAERFREGDAADRATQLWAL